MDFDEDNYFPDSVRTKIKNVIFKVYDNIFITDMRAAGRRLLAKPRGILPRRGLDAR